MNLIFILTYLFGLKNYKSKKTSGKDERHPLVEEKTIINKCIENNQKKILLDYLQSNNINIYYKINSINEFYGNNNPKPFNLSSGGLLDDWNFEM
jgi:hypothetical protein